MSNRTYDFLKYIAQIVLPGTATLYFTVAALWGLPKADEVVGTIVAIDTFMGVLLQLSSSKYKGPDYDGSIAVKETENKITFVLEPSSDMGDWRSKDEVRLKITP